MRKISILSCFVIVAIIASCGGKDTRTGAELLEAQKPYRQGSVQEQKLLRKAVIASPGLGKAWMEKSVAWNKRADYYQGFSLVNKAVEVEPIEYLGYRGHVKLYMLHDYWGALQDFYRLDSLTPGLRDAPWGEDIDHLVGLSYRCLGKHDSAIVAFDRSIEGITRESGAEWVNIWTHLYQALSYRDLGNVQLAENAFDTAISYYDKFTEAHYYKGKILMKKGDPALALQSFQKADSLMKASYIYRNSYYELPDQVYASDIEAMLLE